MNLRDFRRAGHTPTLLTAFLYFDVSFMIWLLPGALANSIVADFGLSDSQKGLMVAVPLLGGAILRLGLGLLTDRIGARRTAILGMSLTVIPLLLGWFWADSFSKILLVGLLLGVAGASFAAALPLASRWYPAKYQGLAMGIAGAGNSGTRTGHLLWPPARPGMGLACRLRPGARSAAGDVDPVRDFRQGQSQSAGASSTPGLCRRAADARHLVVLPALRDYIRRLRRPGELPERLLSQPVRPVHGRRRQFRDALRRGRLVHPANRRIPRGSIRRCSHAHDSLPWRRGRSPGAVDTADPSPRGHSSCSRRWRCSAWAMERYSSSYRSGFPRRSVSRPDVIGAAGGFGGFVLPTILARSSKARVALGRVPAVRDRGRSGRSHGNRLRKQRLERYLYREERQGPGRGFRTDRHVLPSRKPSDSVPKNPG